PALPGRAAPRPARAAAGREPATPARSARSRLAPSQPPPTADALLAAPGVDVSRTGPWASRISMRGLAGERVLVLVDGVRLQAGRGHGAQTSLVSVDRLRAGELLPGRGGAVCGREAVGGGGVLDAEADRPLGEPGRGELGARPRALHLTARRSRAGGGTWPAGGARDARRPRAQQQLPRGRAGGARGGEARPLGARHRA